jgi:hypothetical protein
MQAESMGYPVLLEVAVVELSIPYPKDPLSVFLGRKKLDERPIGIRTSE